MRKFLWEISLGVPVVIFIFSITTLLLMNLNILGVENVPAKEMGVIEWSVIVVFGIVLLFIIMLILGLTILLWSKAVSRYLNKDSRAEIIHGFIRTPSYGWSYRFNTRYVNWVLENS